MFIQVDQDETTQVSRERSLTCVHIPALNAILITLDIRIWIPKNKSNYTQYEHMQRLGDVITLTW